MIIAIDGPAGSGKSSTAKALAGSLNYLHINSGAMYRAIAFSLNARGLDHSEDSVGDINSELEFIREEESVVVEWSGQDITDTIRGEETGELASRISQIPFVRDLVGDHQRDLASRCLDEGSGVVIDGRDIGTVVFPDADIKIFLDAEPEVRAARRVDQLEKSGEENVEFELVLSELIKRDRQDQNRDIAPLKKASDAIVVDTTELIFEEQLEVVKTIVDIRLLVSDSGNEAESSVD